MKCLEDIRFVMELLVRENKTSNKKINKLLKLLSAINLELAKDKQKEKPLDFYQSLSICLSHKRKSTTQLA